MVTTAAPAGVADDQGAVIEARVIALLNRGVKGVAVDMSDVEVKEFGMCDKALAAAGRTLSGSRDLGKVAALSAHDCWHGSQSAICRRGPKACEWRCTHLWTYGERPEP